MVSEKVDVKAGLVLKAMFRHVENYILSVNDQYSRMLSFLLI